MTAKEVINLYVKCQSKNQMQPLHTADVDMYWEDEGPKNIHTETISLVPYGICTIDDDKILFYADGVEGLIGLMEKDNGSDFVVTEVLDFY